MEERHYNVQVVGEVVHKAVFDATTASYAVNVDITVRLPDTSYTAKSELTGDGRTVLVYSTRDGPENSPRIPKDVTLQQQITNVGNVDPFYVTVRTSPPLSAPVEPVMPRDVGHLRFLQHATVLFNDYLGSLYMTLMAATDPQMQMRGVTYAHVAADKLSRILSGGGDSTMAESTHERFMNLTNALLRHQVSGQQIFDTTQALASHLKWESVELSTLRAFVDRVVSMRSLLQVGNLDGAHHLRDEAAYEATMLATLLYNRKQ